MQTPLLELSLQTSPCIQQRPVKAMKLQLPSLLPGPCILSWLSQPQCQQFKHLLMQQMPAAA